MHINVTFYSYFKDLTGCGETVVEVPEGACLQDVVNALEVSFPKLVDMRRSSLVAVGVEYVPRETLMKDGDQVAFFPPVQGG